LLAVALLAVAGDFAAELPAGAFVAGCLAADAVVLVPDAVAVAVGD
jgi:hypothetical protein